MTTKQKSIWRIEHDGTGFLLITPEGAAIAGFTGVNPVQEATPGKLADYAFERGADEVKHDYDLVKHQGSGRTK